ncbi:YebO family protein [Ewingella sp. S1.OA.A_B6]
MFDVAMGQSSLASLVLCVLFVLLFLLLWFVVNRASVRANQQIQLLQEIAAHQRQQTDLLKILAGQAAGKKSVESIDDDSALSLRGFIPER